jgi:hypothetical protein
LFRIGQFHQCHDYQFTGIQCKGKDTRIIYMKLDDFRSHRPIYIIVKTGTILIIDDLQSVGGKQAKECLKEFQLWSK